MKFYMYEHINGQVIRKNAFVVENGTTPEEYFDSPFVKRWWIQEVNEEAGV